MTSERWWYLISMVGLGISMAVMLWAARINVVIVILSALNAAYWGMAAFGEAEAIRREESKPRW